MEKPVHLLLWYKIFHKKIGSRQFHFQPFFTNKSALIPLYQNLQWEIDLMGRLIGLVLWCNIAVCNDSISYVHWIETQMLNYRSSFLLMCLKKQWKMVEVLEPQAPMLGDPDDKPGSWPSWSHLENQPRMKDHFLCLSNSSK